MQNLQLVNNAANANYQQLTQQHIITMPLYQFDFIYGPSPDRIGGPAIRSPWGPVPVTAPNGQTGPTCRTLRILQDLARPLPGHRQSRYCLGAIGRSRAWHHPIAKPFQCIPSIS